MSFWSLVRTSAHNRRRSHCCHWKNVGGPKKTYRNTHSPLKHQTTLPSSFDSTRKSSQNQITLSPLCRSNFPRASTFHQLSYSNRLHSFLITLVSSRVAVEVGLYANISFGMANVKDRIRHNCLEFFLDWLQNFGLALIHQIVGDRALC